MLAILGALTFGIVATGAWMSADNQELKNRQRSLKSGSDFYFDKSGRLRHTKNGKRFTPEEIQQFYNPKTIQEKNEEFDKKWRDISTGKFYRVVINTTNHYFLSKEEALKFYNDNKGKYVFVYLDDLALSKRILDIANQFDHNVYHFDYDKHVGKIEELWRKR